MKDVETQKRVRSDLDAADQRKAHLISEDGCIRTHVGSNGYGPQRQLIPWEQIPGEGEQQREEQEHDSNDPVEFARWLVRTVVEHAAHVEEHGEHHDVGTPPMHVAHHLAECNIRRKRLEIEVGLR